jgi:hypothetical protein
MVGSPLSNESIQRIYFSITGGDPVSGNSCAMKGYFRFAGTNGWGIRCNGLMAKICGGSLRGNPRRTCEPEVNNRFDRLNGRERISGDWLFIDRQKGALLSNPPLW